MLDSLVKWMQKHPRLQIHVKSRAMRGTGVKRSRDSIRLRWALIKEDGIDVFGFCSGSYPFLSLRQIPHCHWNEVLTFGVQIWYLWSQLTAEWLWWVPIVYRSTEEHFASFQGKLKGFDQTVNVILEGSHERVYSSTSGVEQVPLGLYIIRGDNV